MEKDSAAVTHTHRLQKYKCLHTSDPRKTKTLHPREEDAHVRHNQCCLL